MTRYRVARIGLVAALVVAVVSACGGGSKATTAKTTTTTAPAATTTSTAGTTTTTINPDEAKAKAALVTLSDLPAGWTASPDTSSPDSSSFGGDVPAQLASCLGVSSSSLDINPPQATSPTFTSTDQADIVDDQVQVFPTVAAANADFGLFSSPKTPSCLTNLFNGPLKADFAKALEPGQTVGPISAVAKSFPRVGDHSGDLQLTFSIQQAGQSVKVFLDLIVITRGRSETVLTLVQPQVVALPQLGAQLAKVAAARMTA